MKPKSDFCIACHASGLKQGLCSIQINNAGNQYGELIKK